MKHRESSCPSTILGIVSTLALLAASDVWAEDMDVQLLFVQGATAIETDTDAKTFRLIDVADQTIYFSDRPKRLAGVTATKTFVEHWGTGDDSFAGNPPNATLLVFDESANKEHASVVILSDPVLGGGNLTYHYELIDGTMPDSGGAAGLFIDTFGPGGGVGAGFHGVGVGARGPGATGWRGVAARNCADGDC